MFNDGRLIIHISTSDSIVTYFGVLKWCRATSCKMCEVCYESFWGEYWI